MRKVVTLNKPNLMLVMMFKAGKLTGMARKLLNSILLSSAQQLRAYQALRGKYPPSKHLYGAHASELLKHIEVKKSNLKSALHEYVDALCCSKIDWEAPDAKTGTFLAKVHVLSKGETEIRNGSLWVSWALHPKIKRALVTPKEFNFTKLDLNIVKQLTSYTAVALYEICARYRNNYVKGGDGQCLTCANPPEWWVDALTNTAPEIDKETGEPIRPEWRSVKHRNVKKAIKQINSVTDLVIELNETRQGKAISVVQFVLRNNRLVPRQIQSHHLKLIETGVRLGLTQELIESSINQWSVEQVSLGLAKFEARRNRPELADVDKPGPYFKSIMNGIAPVKVVATADISQDFKPLTATADKSTEQVKSAQTLAKEKLLALPVSEIKDFANRARRSLEAKGFGTEKIRREVDADVWKGIVLAEMVDIFIGAGDSAGG